MKTLATFAFLLASFNVFSACPNLEGSYLCQTESIGSDQIEYSEMQVSQDPRGAYIDFEFSDEEDTYRLMLNGQPQVISDEEGERMVARSYCQQGVIVSDMIGDYTSDEGNYQLTFQSFIGKEAPNLFWTMDVVRNSIPNGYVGRAQTTVCVEQ